MALAEVASGPSGPGHAGWEVNVVGSRPVCSGTGAGCSGGRTVGSPLPGVVSLRRYVVSTTGLSLRSLRAPKDILEPLAAALTAIYAPAAPADPAGLSPRRLGPGG